MELKEALMNLDALDDDQWTADGVPKLDILAEVVGKKVKRQEVVDAAPEFTRDNMIVPEDEPKEEDPAPELEEDPLNLAILKEYVSKDPMPEREFLMFLGKIGSIDLPALETVLIEQLDQTVKTVDRAQDLRNRIKLSLAYTRSRIKREIPNMSNQQAIQEFIISQTKSREERVLKTHSILKGIDLKDLDPRAAIDRAMARKTVRGTKRPTRII